jgi:hypothetical protein
MGARDKCGPQQSFGILVESDRCSARNHGEVVAQAATALDVSKANDFLSLRSDSRGARRGVLARLRISPSFKGVSHEAHEDHV